VSSISAKSAGPGTRANIDEFTETTSTALQVVGGAQRGKAVMIINPADPPVLMRNTVYCLVDGDADHHAIENDVLAMVEKVTSYVPATASSNAFSSKRSVPSARCTSRRPASSPAPG
jgi:acetaldehyde dehydrogenase